MDRRGRLPLVLLVPALIGLAFLVLPLAGLVARAPWRTLPAGLSDPEILVALRLSLVCATLATVVCIVLGVPLAWLLARSRSRATGLLRALVTVPLVLPPVVGGVALLFVLGRRGLVGQWLDRWFDVQLPFTTTAVVLAEAFVAMPFLVLAVEGALRGADRRFEEAAATLGASRWYVFRRVTLPLVAPGIMAGAVLAWARALGEFGATITFAGNAPNRTTTMPIAVYLALRGGDTDAAIVLSLVMLVVSVLVLVLLRDRWLRGRWYDADRASSGRSAERSGSTSSSTSRLAGCWRCSARTAREDHRAARPGRPGAAAARARRARRRRARRRAHGTHVPTEARPVGVVFQDYLLLPHLSALENVAFGLRARGMPRRPARERSGPLAGAGRPRRVRGIASRAASRAARRSAWRSPGHWSLEPRLLLLDEPLAALDASTRLDVRVDLRSHLDAYDGSTVLVTHDPIDAMVLADRIAVLEDGRVVQEGTPTEVARAPRTDYVARLVGLNLLRGTARDGRATLEDGGEVVLGDRVDGAVLVAIAPSAVAIFPERPVGSPRNCWPLPGRAVRAARRHRPPAPDRTGATDGRRHPGRACRATTATRHRGVGRRQGDRDARLPGLTKVADERHHFRHASLTIHRFIATAELDLS